MTAGKSHCGDALSLNQPVSLTSQVWACLWCRGAILCFGAEWPRGKIFRVEVGRKTST